MAWGTETCPKVDKILGPGNQYVTAAKMLLQNSEAMISIDMPAGPSEVLVIADGGASPAHVASDLLSQVRPSGARPLNRYESKWFGDTCTWVRNLVNCESGASLAHVASDLLSQVGTAGGQSKR